MITDEAIAKLVRVIVAAVDEVRETTEPPKPPG
jgi:hypothetical protein